MQQQLTTQSRSLGRIAIITLAGLAYFLNLVGVVWMTAIGDLLSALALLLLGLAVSGLTLARFPLNTQPLEGRLKILWNRQRWFALSTTLSVYLALVLGSFVTDSGGLWTCTTLPLCSPAEDRAAWALVHRGSAATATLFVLALALWVMRTHSLPALQKTARWAVGLILLQNVVGLLMVLAAAGNIHLPLLYTRLAHLAVGAVTWSATVILTTQILRIAPNYTARVRAEERTPTLLQDYFSLTKPRVITLLIFTTMVALFITPAGIPSWSVILWTLIGGWLMPAGAQSINCYFDSDIDAKMGRTSRRPIPSGRIPAWHALVLGIALGALAFAILWIFVNPLTAWTALLGYIYYAVVYTVLLKRHSVHNIVIGGGAGAIPPLVGWAAATGTLTWPSFLLFVIIFMWTPPHFWALALIRRKDYANAGVPMLPVVSGDEETKRQILIYTIITVATTLLLTPLEMMGIAYAVMAAALGGVFLYYVLRMIYSDTTKARWSLYGFSLLYLFLLFAAMLVDRLVFA
ncbi:MAG: heme o synthase [Caldilineaceae bacterium]